MTACIAENAWLPHGWATNVALDVTALNAAVGDAARARDASAALLGKYVVPGMPNVHSHAFQRAMAGLAERQTNASDSFWTWRETMYAFAGRIGPEALRAIAAQVFVEMLKSGYTHVCEFNYLHRQPDGKPYADAATMSLALIEAARDAGIGLTLLPTLYMTGGFDQRALSDRQQRFGLDVETYLRLLQTLRSHESPTVRIGAALHSLRAVPESAMREVLASGLVDAAPIHIHIAEQIGEVQDSLSLRNARPVDWLLDHAQVDARWCLVHATHMTPEETIRLARTGAVVGLCPTTEANLGDGLFPLKRFLDAQGTIAIGSDSNVSVSPIEELRWLEYGQRLATRHRNIAVSELTESVGETMWGDALFGGAQASGVAAGALNATLHDAHGQSCRADLLVLDEASPLLAARRIENIIDTLIFAGNTNLVKHVMVDAAWVVRDFHHRDEERIASDYRAVVAQLSDQL